MPAPLPKTKAEDLAEKYGTSLSDREIAFDELTLRRVLTEVRAAMKAADRDGLAILHTLEGLVEVRRGQLDKAYASYLRAHRIKPDDALIEANLGRALLELRRDTEAIPHFVRLLSRPDLSHGFELHMLLNLATCLWRVGRRSESRAAFERAVRLAPDGDAAAQFRLAEAAAELEREDDAVEFLARSICAARGSDRGEQPALDLVTNTSAAGLAGFRQVPVLASAIDAVAARDREPVPDEMQTPAERVLSPEGWANFVRLIEG